MIFSPHTVRLSCRAGWTITIFILSSGQTDRQVVASGRKFNLRRDLRWVAKRTGKFPHKYTRVAKKHFKADISCISLANNPLMDVTQLGWLELAGQTVKNLPWLACKFDLDQIERKSSQINASARKPWPNGVASLNLRLLASPFGQGFTLSCFFYNSSLNILFGSGNHYSSTSLQLDLFKATSFAFLSGEATAWKQWNSNNFISVFASLESFRRWSHTNSLSFSAEHRVLSLKSEFWPGLLPSFQTVASALKFTGWLKATKASVMYNIFAQIFLHCKNVWNPTTTWPHNFFSNLISCHSMTDIPAKTSHMAIRTPTGYWKSDRL